MGSWHTPTGRQIGRIKTAVVRMAKKILAAGKAPVPTSAANILTAAEILEPRARLAVERLLYAQRLFHHGPAFVQLNLHVEHDHNPHSWLTGLKHDLRWLHGVDVQADPILLGEDLTDLIDQWQRDQGGWKRRVRRAARRHIFQETIIQEVHRWHSDIFSLLRAAHYTFTPDPALLRLQTQEYQCPFDPTGSPHTPTESPWDILPRTPPIGFSHMPCVPDLLVVYAETTTAPGIHAPGR